MQITPRFLLGLGLCASLFATPVLAKSKAKEKPVEETPSVDEDTIAGEAFVHSNVVFDFPKFTLDGKEWDNHEIVGKKTLVIHGLDRTQEHTLVVSPGAGYEGQTVTIKSTDYKKTVTKTKGNTKTLAFRANFKVDFPKKSAEKPADKPVEKPATDKK